VGRGCAAFAGARFRFRKPEAVVDEIQRFCATYPFRDLAFVDDSFTAVPTRAIRIASLLRDKVQGIRWSCFSHVSTFDEKLARTLVESGCHAVQFGVESADDDLLRSMGKNTSVAKVREAIEVAKRTGMETIFCSFLLGHPRDSHRSIEKTIAFIRELSAEGPRVLPAVALFVPFPGTPAAQNARRFGITKTSRDWEKYTFAHVTFESENYSASWLRDEYAKLIWDLHEIRKQAEQTDKGGAAKGGQEG